MHLRPAAPWLSGKLSNRLFPRLLCCRTNLALLTSRDHPRHRQCKSPTGVWCPRDRAWLRRRPNSWGIRPHVLAEMSSTYLEGRLKSCCRPDKCCQQHPGGRKLLSRLPNLRNTSHSSPQVEGMSSLARTCTYRRTALTSRWHSLRARLSHAVRWCWPTPSAASPPPDPPRPAAVARRGLILELDEP